MTQPHTTSWRLIQGAAAGVPAPCDEFVRRYGPAAREYLAARWRKAALDPQVDDAVQEVFVECFRPGGVLARAEPTRPGGFRAFFFGVVRNIALRHEQRASRPAPKSATPSQLNGVAAIGESPSVVFDRAWARAVMKAAAARHSEHSRARGEAAVRRYEILRLRFQEGLPIRAIAELWQQDPKFLHHEYATARKEFEAALREVVAEREPGSIAEQERILRELVDTLG